MIAAPIKIGTRYYERDPDDSRFNKDLGLINSETVRIATIDGAMEDIIAKTDFPNAKRESLTELSPFVHILLNVVHNEQNAVVLIAARHLPIDRPYLCLACNWRD